MKKFAARNKNYYAYRPKLGPNHSLQQHCLTIKLYWIVGILHTCGKQLHDHIISPRVEGLKPII